MILGLVIIILSLVPLQSNGEATNDPYQKMVTEFVGQMPPGITNLIIGDFTYADTKSPWTYSHTLRQNVKRVLFGSKRFNIIPSDFGEDIDSEEARMRVLGVLKSNQEMTVAPISGFDAVAVVVGTYEWSKSRTVKVYVEAIRPTTPRKTVAYTPFEVSNDAILSDSSLGGIAAKDKIARLPDILVPQNLKESRENLDQFQKELIENRLEKIPKRFDLTLTVKGGETSFAGGERITFRVRSEIGCHLALFCHQSDGSTVVLFPNRYNRNTLIPSGVILEIPGRIKGGFGLKIMEPFGKDIVQAIACSEYSHLHELISKTIQAKFEPLGEEFEQEFVGLTRGIGVVAAALDKSKAEPALVNPLRESKWSQAHLVIDTYPALGNRRRAP